MRAAPFLTLTALLLSSACHKAGDVDLKNATVEEVAKASAGAQKINPGKWQMTMQTVSVDIPGQGAAAAAMSKAMTAKPNVTEECVTKEQADNPNAGLFAGKNPGNCKFDSFAMSGGKLNAVMKCAAPDKKGEMSMTMAGQYGGDSYDMTSEMHMTGATGLPGGAGMTIKMHNSGKRIGACG
jgi:Protein of unknown function (DUF3617)